jgi:hypothetical protein
MGRCAGSKDTTGFFMLKQCFTMNLKQTGTVSAVALLASTLTACGGGGSSSSAPSVVTTPASVITTTTTTTPAKTFAKLDKNGVSTTSPTPACVTDNAAGGKIWEVKTTLVAVSAGGTCVRDGRDKDYGYTWYAGTTGSLGSAVGTGADSDILKVTTCSDVGTNCNTAAYITYVNSLALCGKTTWRLPTAAELSSLVDTSKTVAPFIYAALGNTSIDTQNYPDDARNLAYWTSTVSPTDTNSRQAVDFSLKGGRLRTYSIVGTAFKQYVRLVAD